MTAAPFPHAQELHPDLDGGLALDLQTLRSLDRRRALGIFGAAGSFAVLGGCGPDSASGSTPTPAPTATASSTPTPTPSSSSTPTPTACTGYARETNGPYPADGTNTSNGSTSNVLTLSPFQRTDIRSTVGTGNQATGVLLDLTLTFVDSNNACAPLAGYAVYLWHCNALGQYSLYDLPNENYLRGIQATNAAGQVSFRTIFPGCYAGRFPHIHFEAFTSLANATSGSFARLISQFALPSAACSAVYAGSGYGNSGSNFSRVSITSDNVFGDNTSAQIAAMTLALTGSAAAGYAGTATIGIAT